MQRIIYILSLALMALTACSDRDTDPSNSQNAYRYDMVTYLGYDEGCLHFDRIDRNNGASTHLYGSYSYEPATEPGSRVLLSYYTLPESKASSTAYKQRIAVTGFSKATTDSLRITNSTRIDTLRREPIRLESIWRTGGYINLQGEIEYSGKPRFFYLVADLNTWTNDTIDCYLVNNSLNQQLYNWRRFYASFYVGAALNRATCKVIRVYLNDDKFPNRNNYCFQKQ